MVAGPQSWDIRGRKRSRRLDKALYSDEPPLASQLDIINIEELLLQGVKESELPNSERICRELAAYPMPDMKKIWQKAKQLSLAKGKSHPDSIIVREPAATVEGVNPAARHRQIVELLQRFEGIARAMKLTIGWGDMEPSEIRRLRIALKAIVSLGTTHLAAMPKEFKE